MQLWKCSFELSTHIPKCIPSIQNIEEPSLALDHKTNVNIFVNVGKPLKTFTYFV